MNILKNFKSYIFQHFWYYRFYIDNKTDKLEFSKIYDNTPQKGCKSKECVLVFNGKAQLWGWCTVHGGLADRLKGIVSVYKLCKETKRDFRIVHTFPYLLEKYLIPNEYDWTTDKNTLIFNSNVVSPHFIRHSFDDENEFAYFRWRLCRLLKSDKCLHIYSNTMMVSDDEFCEGFHELFKPSEIVQKEIVKNQAKLGGAYISLSFRFTHLLGDSVDVYMKELSTKDKCSILEKTINSISFFHKKYPNNKLLINSDSAIFLSKIRELNFEYVYIIPGIPVHIDQTTDASEESYVKTFVDFFMISKAERILLIKTEEMRNSGFPKCAAIVGNKPFEVVNI